MNRKGVQRHDSKAPHCDVAHKIADCPSLDKPINGRNGSTSRHVTLYLPASNSARGQGHVHVCACKAGQPNGSAGPFGHLGPSPPTRRLAWRHRAPCTSASVPGTASAVTSTCACMYVCVCVCVCKPLPTHSGCCPATLPAPLGRLPLL